MSLQPLDFPGFRRRSVDTGGLALSSCDSTTGGGWGGWDDCSDIPLAELLSSLYSQTLLTLGMPNPTALTSSSPRRTRLVESLSSWFFNPHTLTSPDDLFFCACLLFEGVFSVDGMEEDLDGVQFQQIPPFLAALQSIYSSANAYHNFHHAVDVLQAMYHFLSTAGCLPPLTFLLTRKWPRSKTKGKRKELKELLRNEDVFMLCIAAIGHDLGHPGFNSSFMNNAKTPLSQLFSTTSPLEQMHSSLLLQLMKHFGLGHLVSTSSPPEPPPVKPSTRTASSRTGIPTPPPSSALHRTFSPRAPRTLFRSLLVNTVLATDMSLHFSWMGKFALFTASEGQGKETEGETEDIDGRRLLVCQALIKFADISNPARPHEISSQWSTSLHSEWCTQSQLETSLSLPLFLNTKGKSEEAKEKDRVNGQIGFIKVFVEPLVKGLCAIDEDFTFYLESTQRNREIWESKLREEPPISPTSPTSPSPAHPLTTPSIVISPVPTAPIAPIASQPEPQPPLPSPPLLLKYQLGPRIYQLTTTTPASELSGESAVQSVRHIYQCGKRKKRRMVGEFEWDERRRKRRRGSL